MLSVRNLHFAGCQPNAYCKVQFATAYISMQHWTCLTDGLPSNNSESVMSQIMHTAWRGGGGSKMLRQTTEDILEHLSWRHVTNTRRKGTKEGRNSRFTYTKAVNVVLFGSCRRSAVAFPGWGTGRDFMLVDSEGPDTVHTKSLASAPDSVSKQWHARTHTHVLIMAASCPRRPDC
jgi:hypothetical protein